MLIQHCVDHLSWNIPQSCTASTPICTQTSVQKGTVAMSAELAHCSVSIPCSMLCTSCGFVWFVNVNGAHCICVWFTTNCFLENVMLNWRNCYVTYKDIHSLNILLTLKLLLHVTSTSLPFYVYRNMSLYNIINCFLIHQGIRKLPLILKVTSLMEQKQSQLANIHVWCECSEMWR